MIQLKDVIHYYIGCDVIVDGKERGRLLGANPIPNFVGQVYWDIQTEEMRLEEDGDFAMPYNDDPDMGELRIKPILRRLSDITDAEWNEIEAATSIMEMATGMGLFKRAFLDGGLKDRYHWQITNEGLIELRKRCVDVDGLIASEQAIDAKTILDGACITRSK